MNTQLKKGALELCVLSQLARGVKFGYVKLKEDEYVNTYLVESGSGPARKYYRLTEKGRQYQSAVKKEWEDFAAAVNRLLA